jgi:hypothetical protein
MAARSKPLTPSDALGHYTRHATTSEWISVIALVISSGAFSLQARSWLASGPRLRLSLMADALTFPRVDNDPKLGAARRLSRQPRVHCKRGGEYRKRKNPNSPFEPPRA